jgi:hypothetical protein
MKKILLYSGLALVLAGAAAMAQNRSFQMTQDLSGIYQSDIVAGHLHIPQAGKGTPVLSSCGSATIVGNDTMGQYTTGAGTTCTLTFATAWPAAPRCFVVPQGNLNYPTYTVSTTAITVTVDVTATAYNYFCIGQ